jgi:hypothetical protein
VLKGKPGEFVEPGLTSEILWSIAGGILTRSETITASKPVSNRHLRVMFPSTSDHLSIRTVDGRYIYSFDSVEVDAAGPLTASIQATGDSGSAVATRDPSRY